MKNGANYLGNKKCEFSLWGPKLTSVTLEILSPKNRQVLLEQKNDGYWQTILEDIEPGTTYQYRLNDQEVYPDPGSLYQPQGVHGPSCVIDTNFTWTDKHWQGLSLESMIFYELHVGTFSREGTFDSIIPRLKDLKQLGVNAIELMPIAQFPGDNNVNPELAYRNWGYDGVYPFAIQNSYGGSQGLHRLIDACHQEGIAVVLDVVFNHFGPEGNYVNKFGPYNNSKYHSLWGDALNFDDAYSQGVRNFFLENALYWLCDYHIDALRLDAVQAIYDISAKHFLEELVEVVEEVSQKTWKRYLIAESDFNNARLIRPKERGGYALDAQWSDDFHHALHVVLTGHRYGYYQDFGTFAQLAKAYEKTFIYDWQYSPDRHRYHGMPCLDCPPSQFSVCIQNHDQIGNQLSGERLSQLISFEKLKLAAGAVLLSPHLPLLFMGEEYGEIAPFTYFVSFSDPDLIQGVRKGRKKEFEALHLDGVPPDPEGVETFVSCKLNWELRNQGKHRILWEYYQYLINLRQTHPALLKKDRQFIKATSNEEQQLLILERWSESSHLICFFNFGQSTNIINITSDCHLILDSSDKKWLGSGSKVSEKMSVNDKLELQPESLVVYELT